MGKVFIGGWIGETTRIKLKVACAVHKIKQQDVIDLLLIKWLKQPHIEDDIKELINGKGEE